MHINQDWCCCVNQSFQNAETLKALKSVDLQQGQDLKFMSLAINLAKKNLGLTAPNPSVGCVIVQNNEIIATATTSRGGRPHAEKVAIDSVFDKQKLVGATLYSTLEPCCHFAVSSPCTDLIIASKIGRVVIGAIDSDSRVNGEGIAKLEAAKIKVSSGIFEKEANNLHRAFLSARITGKPFLTLKIATSLDGKIATKSGASRWISGEISRKYAHMLRAENDAILVGANTIRQDNPNLDCRIEGLESSSPQRLILSKSLNFTFEERIFACQNSDENNLSIASPATILLTCQTNSASEKLQNWLQKNPNNQAVFFDKFDDEDRFDFEVVLKKIYSLGLNSLLVEGGSAVATQLLKQNLVDELIWIRSKKIIGNDGIAALQNLGVNQISESLDNFQASRHKILGDDFAEIFSK